MSKYATIIDALQDQLQAATSLSSVDDLMIMKGVRESVATFPAIFIEPLGTKEEDYSYPKERLTARIAIMGFLRVLDKDKQIAGDVTTPGILDLENNIKLAIDVDRTIGGNAIHADIVETTYEFEEYPIRGVSVILEILFEQTRATRT